MVLLMGVSGGIVYYYITNTNKWTKMRDQIKESTKEGISRNK